MPDRLANQMRDRHGTDRCKGQSLALSGYGDHLFEVVCLRLAVGEQDHRGAAKVRYSDQIGVQVIRHFAQQRLRLGMRQFDDGEGVSVGRGFGGHVYAKRAPQCIGTATRGPRHDQSNRLVRKALGARAAGVGTIAHSAILAALTASSAYRRRIGCTPVWRTLIRIDGRSSQIGRRGV